MMQSAIAFVLVLVGLLHRGHSVRMLDCEHPTKSHIEVGTAIVSNYIEDEELKSELQQCGKFFAGDKDSECPFLKKSFPEKLSECNTLIEKTNVKDIINHHMIEIALKFADNMFDSIEYMGECDSQEEVLPPEEAAAQCIQSITSIRELISNVMGSDIIKSFMEDTQSLGESETLAPIKSLIGKLSKSHGSKFITAFQQSCKNGGLSEDTVKSMISCGTQVLKLRKSE